MGRWAAILEVVGIRVDGETDRQRLLAEEAVTTEVLKARAAQASTARRDGVQRSASDVAREVVAIEADITRLEREETEADDQVDFLVAKFKKATARAAELRTAEDLDGAAAADQEAATAKEQGGGAATRLAAITGELASTRELLKTAKADLDTAHDAVDAADQQHMADRTRRRELELMRTRATLAKATVATVRAADADVDGNDAQSQFEARVSGDYATAEGERLIVAGSAAGQEVSLRAEMLQSKGADLFDAALAENDAPVAATPA